VGGPKILIVAGETSGETHAARLAEALLEREPRCRLFGMGGPRMRQAGVRLLADEDLGVIGFAEVLRHLPTLRRVRSRLIRFLREERPDLFIPVDYPGLNLQLCKTAKRYDISVMYYISPQVWAWGHGRVAKIAERVDRMITILPFEAPLYEAAGVDVHFVGHPLLESLDVEVSDETLRRELYLGAGDRIVGLLPGSRRDEVDRLFPVMVEAAGRIRARVPDISFVAAAASGERARQLQDLHPNNQAWLRVVTGRTRAIIHASEVALVASGTATLEAACLGTPMVVLYRLSWLSWLIGRMLVKVPHIALANLVAGERIVPEFLQHDATGPRVAAEAVSLLESEERRAHVRRALGLVRQRLGAPGASGRAASLALSLLDTRLVEGPS